MSKIEKKNNLNLSTNCRCGSRRNTKLSSTPKGRGGTHGCDCKRIAVHEVYCFSLLIEKMSQI